MVLVGVLAVVLAAVGAVAAVARNSDDNTQSAVVGQAPPTSTTTTTAGTAATASVGTTVPSTVPASTTTTSPKTTTTRRAATTTTTTTKPAAPTTTTRPTPPPTPVTPLCAADQIEVNTLSDATSYTAGQVVKLTTTIRNRSASACFYRGYDVAMNFLDPSGHVVAGSQAHADDVGQQTFAPGQVLSQTSTWDPSACGTPPCATPAPGIYSVQATWAFSGGIYGFTHQFVLH